MAHGASDGFRGNQSKTVKAQNEPLPKSNKKKDSGTAQRLANEYGVGRETVKRAEKFSKGIDVIEKQESELKDTIL
ncbi:MAG: hypothetical protein LIP12_00765 [Clostridiales bacterium]|nr:hypothetical protein [Clostridiales bacterium]